MVTKEDYLKAKKIVEEYEDQEYSAIHCISESYFIDLKQMEAENQFLHSKELHYLNIKKHADK